MSRVWSRARRMLGAVTVVALVPAALVALTSGPVTAAGPGCSGATIEVTTNTDAALRAAFVTASGLAGPQTICIDSGLGTITLGGTELAYTAVTSPALTVRGNGITISGNNTSRVINSVGLLTLDGVTITGGNATGAGGGVTSAGNVVLTNSTISGNTGVGSGGGVWANGNVVLTNSTIGNNTVTGVGAAGGGVWANGNVTVTNSTISGNTATGAGGEGGGVLANGTATLVYATVIQNSALSGANVRATVGLTSFGSVVAQAGGGGANCAVGPTTTSNGFNFSDDASAAVSCRFNAATDRVGTSNDPQLGALANNGGPTPTRLPQAGSPLIDAIPNAACQTAPLATGITTDQRGLARPDAAGRACDIGAVEVNPQITAVVGADGRTVTVTGSQFPPSTATTVSIASTPTTLGTVTTSSTGTFAQSFTVPCAVDAGAHTVSATASSGQSASAAVTLTACAITVTPRFTG